MTVDVQWAADALLTAYRTRQPISPIAARFADAPLSTAYEIALAQVESWVKDGDVVKGHKVGLRNLRSLKHVALKIY